MKKIIIILLAIIVSSCGVTELKMYQRQYSLKNESGQIVKLKFYLTSNNQISNELIIDNNGSSESQIIEFDQPHSNNSEYIIPPSAFSKGGDSLEVIYNNQKRSVFFVNFNGTFSIPTNRNLYRFGNYTNVSDNKFQYIFTEEDYGNAEDCGGNCD